MHERKLGTLRTSKGHQSRAGDSDRPGTGPPRGGGRPAGTSKEVAVTACRTLDGRDPFEDAIPGMQVGEERSMTIGGHVFRIVATEQVGCDSGRRRYRVECHTCELVVHEATTGPHHMARGHLRDVEEGYVDPLQAPLAAGRKQASS